MLSGKTHSSKAELLREVPLFSACSDEELAEIASLTVELPIDEGRVLTREGRPGRECFIVADGEAEVHVEGEEVARVDPGAIIGEMSLLDDGPRSATVVAATPMRVYVLTSRELSALLNRHQTVARKVLRELAARVRALEGAPEFA